MMGGMGLAWIFGLILIAAIVWAALRIAGTSQGRETRERLDRKDAVEILKERYARGEIGKEEFDRMKHDLA